jgi:hypothetical protein
VGGLVVFAVLVTTPFWYGIASGKGHLRPELARPAQGTKCVEPVETMRASHMAMLNEWRDAVVRQNERVYVATDGARHPISLSGTCLKCHAEPEKFCDRCHSFSGVSPYCWDCHLQHPMER